MDFTSYQLVADNTGSLNTGSYLNRTEYSLFVNGYSPDIWFGFSANDVIEMSVWDRDNNFIAWGVLNQSKSFNEVTLSYLNVQNISTTYSYSELVSDYILYNNSAVLVSPTNQFQTVTGLETGSYFFVYNFTREMAGSNIFPLVIKEISPSGTELKLVPLSGSNDEYEAFCLKKVLLQDVSPLYLKAIKSCPYGQIFAQVSPSYQDQINTIKSLFYLTTDGAMVDFLKHLYEDVLIFKGSKKSSTFGVQVNNDQLIRIQGIQTTATNYLLSSSNDIVNFSDIDQNYNAIVSASVERKFSPIGAHPTDEYVQAKAFLYAFFTQYFYQPLSDNLSQTYNTKYYSYLKNALNVGNNRLLPILNTDYLDEREDPSDPLTLLVKLESEIPSDLMIQTQCWVSNISLAPYVVNSIVQTSNGNQVFNIGPPNFSLSMPNVAQSNTNKLYSANDLEQVNETDRELTISKNLTRLNVDYSNFSNFIVFSSAETRLKIFKNKVINLSTLSSSLQALNNINLAFQINSGSNYPFYTSEYESTQGKLNDIVDSFDGYESYLYRTGNYTFASGSFISASYIADVDYSASLYDKNNRDSLIHNCPAHILEDEQNNDYIIFLTMTGHFFDEIYEYITNLPGEKIAGNSATEEFTRQVVDYMLETFGWTVDDTLEQTTLLNNYLTVNQNADLNEMSAEERLKVVRNRILLNLPLIYKTKGTETAISMLLSCYGIPSTLLSIREYGGVNRGDNTAAYTTYERTYLYQWNTASIHDTFALPAPSGTSTYLAKVLINGSEPYTYGKQQILFGRVSGSAISSSISGSGEWAVGFVRVPEQNSAKVFFRIGYKGAETFTMYSNTVPLFDGNIYSIMLRRNIPSTEFEFTTNVDAVPCVYDLYIQKNLGGIPLVTSTSSMVCYDSASNQRFDLSTSGSNIMIGGWFADLNGQGFTGAMDKWQMWADPITDENFEDYVNNINSYSFTGSRPAEQSLLFRMHTDYPFNMQQIASGSPVPAGFGISGSYATSWVGSWRNANSFYAISSSQKQADFLNAINPPSVDFMVNTNAWGGSQTLVYNSASCKFVSQSVYPFQFAVVDYPSTLANSRFGPNRFRNEKVNFVSQSVASRFDINERSTYVPVNSTSPDSNQIGIYVDPQDFKNKDIIRFFGNYDLMDTIGDPANQFSGSYSNLKMLRDEFAAAKNEYSGSKTLFNELITLYKLYFNQSIFEAIKNLVPARTNALVGVIIEPTILERPKYFEKPVFSEMNSGSVFYADITASHYFRDPNTKLVRMTQSLEYGEFGLITSSLSGFDSSSLPANRTMDIDLSYLNLPNAIYANNYLLDNGNYNCDIPDDYQLGHFGSLSNILQWQQGNLTSGKIPFDMNEVAHQSGSTARYLMKRWQKYNIYSKSGSWNRTDFKGDNLYATNSIYLYDYIAVTDTFFNSVAYTSSIVNGIPGNPGSEFGLGFQWTHYANTFQQSPNAVTNNYLLTGHYNGIRWIYNLPAIFTTDGTYLEIVGGYPRNHFTHKRDLFSLYNVVTYGIANNVVTSGSYRRNQQTINTTVGNDGLQDGSAPVQINQVSNVNLIQSNNVISQ